MTTKLPLLTTVLLVLAAGNAGAQSISESLRGLAEQYNEQQDDDAPDGETAANEPTEEERQEWADGWGKRFDENAEILGAMDNPELRCVAMMVLYVYEHESLVDMTDREGNCKRKYDLYGMQLLSLATSTTIMYCPEGLNAYSNEQLDRIGSDYKSILMGNVSDRLFEEIQAMFNESNSDDELPEHGIEVSGWSRLVFKTMYLASALRGTNAGLVDVEAQLNVDAYFIRSLIRYFTPRYVLTKTFQISQKMEALGCAP
jgi:hypothetical protein